MCSVHFSIHAAEKSHHLVLSSSFSQISYPSNLEQRDHFQTAYCPPYLTKYHRSEKNERYIFSQNIFSSLIGILTATLEMIKDDSNWNIIWKNNNWKASWDSNWEIELGLPVLQEQGCQIHLDWKSLCDDFIILRQSEVVTAWMAVCFISII